MNTRVVLDDLIKSFTYCVFGHSVMRNLKVKITGVMWHLAIPQSV